MICDTCGKDHSTLSWAERWQCYAVAMDAINKKRKEESMKAINEEESLADLVSQPQTKETREKINRLESAARDGQVIRLI